MRDVYIVESLRTPFGAFSGSLSTVPAPELAATVIREILKKTGLNGSEIDEVILGQVLQGGAGQAPARQAMRLGGVADSVHAMTINKVCGSGLKSLMLGAQAIMLGDSELVLTGGMENMSMAPYAMPKARSGCRMGDAKMIDLMVHDGLTDPYSGRHMGELSEGSAEKYDISREDQDVFAARSYQLSQKAVSEGIFAAEIVPVTVKTRKGDIVVATDEDPFNGKIEKLPTLRTAFKKDGTITAGNASSINDGASVTLLASKEAVDKYNLTVKARLVAYASNSIHPDQFGEAPIEAIEKALEKAGLKQEDIDLFEINEAFSSVPLMAIKQLGIDPEKVNVNGGAVAIGHPVGSSGGRLVNTLLRELAVQNKRYGLATLCIGGGEAVACIFEAV